MVGVIGDGRSVAIGPAESPMAEDDRAPFAPAHRGVVRTAGEEEVVRIGRTSVCPFARMVHFAVIPGYQAIGVGAAAVPGVADEPLIRGGDAFLPAQVQRAAGVLI